MSGLTDLLKLCMLLALPLGIACSNVQGKAQGRPALPFLLFQKTPCFGVCPAYEAAIDQAGGIRFVGWEHVPVKDTVYLQLSQAELQLLQQQVAQVNYTGLRDYYPTNWSDMPSTITTFYEKGKEVKQVKHEEGGPQHLLDLQDSLHQRIMELVEEEAKRRLPTR